MKIAIVLLKRSTKPIGGYKVVYEYADALAESGDNVTIIYNYAFNLSRKKQIPVILKKTIYTLMYIICKPWYPLHQSIKEKKVWSINSVDLSTFDVAIATAAHTAVDVSRSDARNKVYFIQGYEKWDLSEEELIKTYKLKMDHIVISKWLAEILRANGESSYLISNGIDEKVFYETIKQEERKEHSIAFMYHIDPIKGISVGIEVIKQVKQKYPDLTVKMFGAYPKGDDVPDWVEYTRNANGEQLRHIYNSVQVFLSTSKEEGFGLTGAESMACGCVLVSTKTQGTLEYAEDENALLADIDDIDCLVYQIDRAFNDECLRAKLSKNAKIKIHTEFNSSQSKQQFVKYIHDYRQ